MSNVRDFGAAGNGTTDDTTALRHALLDGDGTLEFPPGEYLVTETILVPLAKLKRFGAIGLGGTPKILAQTAGPVFHLLGTHEHSADPTSFKPGVWKTERMPTFLNLEIEGRHPESDGIVLEQTMQATLEGVLLRDLRHGLRAFKRNRNILVSHCHIYNLRGIGIWFDRLNLHQAIIVGSHISYCKRGGIRIEGSEIRNLQITGNDIEYNYDLTAAESADVWIDSRGDAKVTVREATISSNTIQAKYSPGGANIRILGGDLAASHKAGMIAITGNILGSQETNVHLSGCRGITLAGNVVYSGHKRNVHLDGCRNIVMSGNSFDHNPDYGPKELCTGVRIENSRDCLFAASQMHDCQAGAHTVETPHKLERTALLEIAGSQRIQVQGCQFLDAAPYAIHVADSSQIAVQGCTLTDARAEPRLAAPLRFDGKGTGNFVAGNLWSKGTAGEVLVGPDCTVHQQGNQAL